MRGIAPQRVLVLEARLSKVLADLVARSGGDPVTVPAVAEIDAQPEEVADSLAALCGGGVALIVLMTGVGTERLHRQASSLGLGDQFMQALERLPIVVRGPKPTAVLHRWGIRPTHAAPSPHTTAEVCSALDALPLAEQRVFVQHYGQLNETLRTYLRSRQAETIDALPYRWALPDDGGRLLQAAHELIESKFDAMLVTSQPQIINLFAVAEQAGVSLQLREALNTRVIVAAVGPTAAAAISRLGVRVVVEPSQPKMAPLVRALADHAQKSSGARATPGETT